MPTCTYYAQNYAGIPAHLYIEPVCHSIIINKYAI